MSERNLKSPTPSSSSSSGRADPSFARHDSGGRDPDTVGIDPSELIGRVLKHVRRSRMHPNVTLHFADDTSFQILVDGYDPRHRGIPKFIEMDPGLEPVFGDPDYLRGEPLTIVNAARIVLADKAFDLGGRESRWDQSHSGIALKFKEDGQWHCLWATLTEYDDPDRTNCVFRSYHDVYLAALHQSQGTKKRAPRRRHRN